MGSKINLRDKKSTGPVPVGSVIKDTNGKFYVWDGKDWINSNKGGKPIPQTDSEIDEDNFDRAMDGI